MSLTTEQRREINRENARKSTGPKSVEGKTRVRKNAMKHGLRARVVALPNEDASEVAARSQSWNDYYRPESPAAQHLVNECVRATLLADRVARYHDAALSKQVRDAEPNWDRTREDQARALDALLAAEPAGAGRLLRRTGHGCRALLARWERLSRAFEARGHWTGPERDEAVLLLGARPDPAGLKACPAAYEARLLNLLAREDPNEAAVAQLYDRPNMPESLHDLYPLDSLPSPESCRDALRAVIARELAALHRQEAALLNDHDAHDRTGARDRALILQDEKEARLFLRYHAESRTAFQRAYGALVKTLRLDEEGASPIDSNPLEVTDSVEPEVTPAVADAPSPNKANLPEGESESEDPTPAAPAGSGSAPGAAVCPAKSSPNKAITAPARQPRPAGIRAPESSCDGFEGGRRQGDRPDPVESEAAGPFMAGRAVA